MDYDYKKRGYLLPEGCKDLIDVLKPKAPPGPVVPPAPTAAHPPMLGEIIVSEPMTVRHLADLLKEKPFRVLEALTELHVFASMDQPLSFEIVVHVLRRYGYAAKKVA